ncbi:hypothetical protein V9T40_010363 [Parthenolecanium corni]|uniref:peptidyl-tRNA hydrolase n=1 Tax=Parthenolecanium corni TaxID=536013 RepID=A0AAN9TPR1_9HEMI
MEYVLTGCASFSLGSALTWMLRHKIYRLQVASRTLHDESKMVIVARTDLPLTAGKLASQCAHAAVSCYSLLKKQDPEFAESWEAHGQPKIVVRCNSESGLMKLANEAHGAKIIAAIIQDAGRTQIRAGTKTVLGIGPARKEDIDKITGHLKLL